MKVEVNIPKIGNLPGTCGWVVNQLNDIEFEFKPMRDVGFGLFYKGRSEEVWGWFASPINGDAEGCDQYKGFNCVYPYDENYDYHMLFGCPLTPAAYEYAQKFIMEVVDQFANQWNNDKI